MYRESLMVYCFLFFDSRKIVGERRKEGTHKGYPYNTDCDLNLKNDRRVGNLL